MGRRRNRILLPRLPSEVLGPSRTLRPRVAQGDGRAGRRAEGQAPAHIDPAPAAPWCRRASARSTRRPTAGPRGRAPARDRQRDVPGDEPSRAPRALHRVPRHEDRTVLRRLRWEAPGGSRHVSSDPASGSECRGQDGHGPSGLGGLPASLTRAPLAGPRHGARARLSMSRPTDAGSHPNRLGWKETS